MVLVVFPFLCFLELDHFWIEKHGTTKLEFVSKILLL